MDCSQSLASDQRPRPAIPGPLPNRRIHLRKRRSSALQRQDSILVCHKPARLHPIWTRLRAPVFHIKLLGLPTNFQPVTDRAQKAPRRPCSCDSKSHPGFATPGTCRLLGLETYHHRQLCLRLHHWPSPSPVIVTVCGERLMRSSRVCNQRRRPSDPSRV